MKKSAAIPASMCDLVRNERISRSIRCSTWRRVSRHRSDVEEGEAHVVPPRRG
jgi:hypothetical protein